ncbi:MAG: hypothetical protein CVU39_16700 [Chloroflexi bacterium HGW-Chloroflexi-10]|nr:MAG: hypothetical protein CVU39_16700 [Chloroflexi bacterium HGW-Chloroflexi-10]
MVVKFSPQSGLFIIAAQGKFKLVRQRLAKHVVSVGQLTCQVSFSSRIFLSKILLVSVLNGVRPCQQ